MQGWSWKDWLVLTWCSALLLAAVLALYPGWPVLGDWWLGTPKGPPGQRLVEWLQAIFTVAAVLVALWLPWQRDLQTAHDARRTAVYRLRLTIAVLEGYAQDVLEEASGTEMLQFIELRAAIEEVLISARTIEAERLNVKWYKVATYTRAIAAQMVVTLQAFEHSAADLTAWRQMRKKFRNFASDLNGLRARAAKPHPGVVAPRVF
ncbi:MAG TPA: hypothetical protein VIL30_02625 [Ramlibacter sp.]